VKNENKINYSSLSDEELAFLAQGKDTEAMEVLIERYKKFWNKEIFRESKSRFLERSGKARK